MRLLTFSLIFGSLFLLQGCEPSVDPTDFEKNPKFDPKAVKTEKLPGKYVLDANQDKRCWASFDISVKDLYILFLAPGDKKPAGLKLENGDEFTNSWIEGGKDGPKVLIKIEEKTHAENFDDGGVLVAYDLIRWNWTYDLRDAFVENVAEFHPSEAGGETLSFTLKNTLLSDPEADFTCRYSKH